jgi:hypothetical protein
MDKSFFFHIWGIYYTHWGHQEQLLIKKKMTADLLIRTMKKSTSIKALCYMHNILSLMWGMKLFVHPDELLVSVKNMANACMGENDNDSMRDIDPYTRMINNIHLPCREICQDIYLREWFNLQRPRISYTNMSMDESIYRVSALIVLH